MRLLKDIEFLHDRVRLHTDEGLEEICITREEFPAWIDQKVAEIKASHVLAAHLKEHMKTDPDLLQFSKLKDKDLELTLTAKDKAAR